MCSVHASTDPPLTTIDPLFTHRWSSAICTSRTSAPFRALSPSSRRPTSCQTPIFTAAGQVCTCFQVLPPLCLPPPRGRKMAVFTAAPLETDPAWVEGFSGGLVGGGLTDGVSYFVQAYNEFFMGLERGVSGPRQQPTARCQGPSRQGCKAKGLGHLMFSAAAMQPSPLLRVQAPRRLQPVRQRLHPSAGREGARTVLARGQRVHRPGQEGRLAPQALGRRAAGRHVPCAGPARICGPRRQGRQARRNCWLQLCLMHSASLKPVSAHCLSAARNRCLHLIKCTEVPAGVHNQMLGPPREPRPYQWGGGGAEPGEAERRRLWRTGSMRAA